VSPAFETDYSRRLDALLRPDPAPRWRALDLFAGCGGLALGFEAAGFETVGFEMDHDGVDTYNRNLAGECRQEFLTEDTVLPSADVIIGGPPCQPFSVGGSQKGLRDDRDGFPAFTAAVAQVQPAIFMFENVRGILYRNKDYYSGVLRNLANLGYIIEESLLNAASFGVPQNRERVVVVGHRNAFVFPEPDLRRVTVAEALGGFLQYAPEDGRYLTPNQDRYIAAYEQKSKCVRPRDLHPEIPSRTLTCRNLGGATSDMHRVALPDGRRRRLLPREAARLQSFPDWFEFYGSEGSQFDQIGNAVAPLFAYRLGKAIAESLAGEVSFPSSQTEEQEVLFLINEPKEEPMSDINAVVERVKSQPTYKAKTPEHRQLVLEALQILSALGLPIEDYLSTPRTAERVAMALLAIADVSSADGWLNAKDISKHSLTSRETIKWQNANLGESRSPGSYDDVRRVDLLWMALAGIAENTGEGSKNAPNRRFGLSVEAAGVIRTFGTPGWAKAVSGYVRGREPLRDLLHSPRRLTMLDVKLSRKGNSVRLGFGPGAHNELIKATIEQFLPRFGHGAEVLYVGDADDRDLYIDRERLRDLVMFDIATDQLPDVVAFSDEQMWIYIIEAVHSSGPVSREKHLIYERLLADCPYGIVYVTAFASMTTFARFSKDIAWETEVWIADNPDHLIHYNGDRFMGPHPKGA